MKKSKAVVGVRLKYLPDHQADMHRKIERVLKLTPYAKDLKFENEVITTTTRIIKHATKENSDRWVFTSCYDTYRAPPRIRKHKP